MRSISSAYAGEHKYTSHIDTIYDTIYNEKGNNN